MLAARLHCSAHDWHQGCAASGRRPWGNQTPFIEEHVEETQTRRVPPRPTSRNRINLNACGIVAPAPAARGRPAEQGHRASRRPCARVCCRVPCWKSAPQKTEELLTSTFSRPPVCTLSVHFIQSSSSSQYTLLRRSSATLCTVRHFPKGKQFNACKECNYQKQIHFCDRRDGGTHCLLRRATALRPDDPKK